MIEIHTHEDGSYDIQVSRINSEKKEIETLIELYKELDHLSQIIIEKFNDSKFRNNRNQE